MSIGARTTRSNDLLTGCLFSNVVFFDAVAVFGSNPRHARVGLHGKDFRTGLYQLRRRDARSGFDVECAQMTTVNQPKVRERG